MKTDVETLDPTKVKLTVEVSGDELAPSIEAAYKEIGQQIQVPGFRKGHVPPVIVDRYVGRGAVLEQAINDSLSGFYASALEKKELRPLDQPNVDVTQVPDPSDKDGSLVFTAEVLIRPEIDLPDMSGIEVEVEGTEVSDEDVNERLDALRERFGTLKGVDRPAEDGDFVVLDLDATIGEESIDSVSGISYQIGAGNMLDGLDEALTGLSAGETTTFNAPLAGGEHAGSEALITVKAETIKERELPEVDDDFAQLASEFDTVDELREDLRSQVAEDKKRNQAVKAQEALLDKLIEDLEIPVPSELVEREVNRHLESEKRQEDDEHRAEVTEETTKQLRTQLLLDAMSEKFEVAVGQGELIDILVRQAQQYGMDPSEFIGQADQAGQIQHYVAEVARGKALVTAVREATVKDPSGEVLDLTEILGPEETAEDQPEGADDGEDPKGDDKE